MNILAELAQRFFNEFMYSTDDFIKHNNKTSERSPPIYSYHRLKVSIIMKRKNLFLFLNIDILFRFSMIVSNDI